MTETIHSIEFTQEQKGRMINELIARQEKRYPHTTITNDNEEAKDIEVFYKGKKVINCTLIELSGAGFKHATKTWKEKLTQ